MNTLLSQIISHATSKSVARSDSALLEALTKLSQIEGLPRVQIESISNSLNNAPIAALKGLGTEALQLKLPPSLAIAPAKQWQFAQVNSQNDATGLLIAQSLHKSTTPISESNLKLLIQQLSTMTSPTIAIETKVQGKVISQSPNAVVMKLESGSKVSLPPADKPLPEGRSYILSVKNNLGNPKPEVQLLPVLNRTNSASPTPTSLSLNKSSLKGILEPIIKEGLSRAGVILVSDTSQKSTPKVPAQVSKIFPESAIKAAALVKVNHGQQVTQTIASTPQIMLSVPSPLQQPVADNSLPIAKEVLLSLPKAEIQKAPTAELPKTTIGQPISHKTIDAPKQSTTANEVTRVKSTVQVADPTELKRTEVHNAIIDMSRSLLTKTGSTNAALTQLNSVLQQLSSLPQSNADASSTVKTIAQRFTTSISDLTPKQANIPLQSPATDLVANSPKEARDTSILRIKNDIMSALHDRVISNAKVDVNSEKPHLLSKHIEQLLPLVSKSKNSAMPLQNIKQLIPVRSASNESAPRLPDAIAQLVQTSALPVSPVQLTTSAPGNSFMQGIIAMLQVSLASKALQRNPSLKQQIDAPNGVIAKTLGVVSNKALPSKVLQDFSSADTKGQLLESLKTILANHQQNKLSSAESRINGQDSFYYVLPSLSENQLPPEIKIFREPERKEHKNTQKGKRKLWNITMKLDIGELGQLLAKSKINDHDITLDFYTSNKMLMTKVADTLPYLKKRLTQMGLIVDKTSVQQGVIPTSLEQRPHHIFETRV